MCGRTSLASDPEDLREIFGLAETPRLAPHYNVPPSQPVAVVRAPRPGQGRTLELMRWDLVPFWADDPKVGHRLSLARIETVATAPAFRDAVRRHRCLVVVDGFYEWKREGKKSSQPFFVQRPGSPALRARGRLGSLGLEGWRGARVVRHPHPAGARPRRGRPRPHARRAGEGPVGPLARPGGDGHCLPCSRRRRRPSSRMPSAPTSTIPATTTRPAPPPTSRSRARSSRLSSRARGPAPPAAARRRGA